MATKYTPISITNDMFPTSQRHSSSRIRQYVYLLVLLTLICLYIFSDELSAIYNLETACDETCSDSNIENGNETNTTNAKIDPPNTVTIEEPEKFVTYLPHSGIHNQRIALENALYLAWYLNRTLILPPAMLGHRFGYKEYDRLLNVVSALRSNKTNLEEQCANEMSNKKSIKECIELHRSYMLTTWDQIFDMTFAEKNVRIIYNHEVHIDKIIKEQLKIDEATDVIYDKLYPGHHAFFDYSIPPEKVEPISDGRILKYYILDDLKKQPQKLLVFASLFGPGTFVRQSQTTLRFFLNIQESLLPKNDIMINCSKKIADKMGGTYNYLLFHGRVGDGTYKFLAKERVNYVINNLKADMPDFNDVNMTLYRNLTDSQKHDLCFKNMTLDPNARKFSRFTRIYLASDVKKSNEDLKIIFQTFPCVYMMSDFEEVLSPLNQIFNSVDNQNMYKFILPLVDLMAGANARKLYTMGRSTFAAYMLRYHHHIEEEMGIKPKKTL